MNKNAGTTYTKQEKYMFLVGVFGQGMLYEIITTGSSYYLQSVIFIPAIVISVLFTVTKIWDAIKNPIMGIVVDRTRTKWGKCRPYLLFSPPAICIITILCFVNSIFGAGHTQQTNTLIVIWAVLSYLLWSICFTATDVPMWGIISLITQEERHRSSLLISARNIVAIGGGVVSFCIVYVSQYVGNLIAHKTGDPNTGLKNGVLIVAALSTIIGSSLFQMAGIFSKERIVSRISEKKSIKQSFKIMWNCAPLRQLLVSGLLRSPVALMRTMQLTLLTYYYGDNGQTEYLHYFILLGGGYMVGQFAAIAATPKIVRKTPKEKAFVHTILISTVPYLLLFAVYAVAPSKLHQNPWLFFVFLIFTGIGISSGMISAMQSLMIADTVDYEEYHSGYRPDAVFYSLQSFLTNFSGGIASMITGIVFSIVGFSGTGVKLVNDALYNGASFKADAAFAPYRTSMLILSSLLPAIGLILSLLPLRKYTLTDKRHGYILEQLKKQRATRQHASNPEINTTK